MDRRHFLTSACCALAGCAALLFTGGCFAPRVSPTVTQQQSQAWQCGNCGHLTRSEQDLTHTRCPRCGRKGFFVKITEKQLQDAL